MDSLTDQFHQFLDGSDRPAWLLSPEGAVLCANPAAQRALGLEATGRPGAAFFAPDEAGRFTAACRRVAAGRAEEIALSGMTLVAGSHRMTLEFAMTPMRHAGRIEALLLRGTPRAHCGAQLPPMPDLRTGTCVQMQQYELLQVAADAAQFGQWYMDADTRRMQASDTYYRMLGYAPGEVDFESRWIRAHIHPDDLETAVKAMESLIAGHSDTYRVDYRLQCKDGRWKWFQAVGHKTRLADGYGTSVICGSLIDITGRKAQETALSVALDMAEGARAEAERSAAMLRLATEHAGVFPWQLDLATGEAEWTDAFYTLIGYAPGEISANAETFKSLLHPDDAAIMAADVDAVLAGKNTPFSQDHRMRHKNGHWVWLSSIGKPISRADQGLSPLLVGTTHDISERMATLGKLERALAEAQAARQEADDLRADAQSMAEILQVSSESADVVPWYRIPEHGKSWLGNNLARLAGLEQGFGYTSQSVEGLIHAEDRETVLSAFAAVETGQSDKVDIDFRLRRADGTIAWVNARGKRLDRSAQGLPSMICGSLIDFTARQHAEKRLKEALAEAEAAKAEAQNRTEMLRNSAICGEIGIWNACPSEDTGWLLDVCYAQLGYAPGDFIPNDEGWRSLIHPDDLNASVEAIEDVIAGRKAIYEYEHRMRHKDGSYHWYRVVARPVDRSAQGLPDLIAGAFSCIDRLKENEHRLAESAEAAQRISDRLNTLADNAPGALFERHEATDGGMSIPYFSAKLPGMLGLSPHEIAADGTAVFRNLHPGDRAHLQAAIAAAREDLSPIEVRFRVMRPEGGMRWLMVSSLPFRQADGNLVWYGNLFDETDRIEALDHAAEAAEAVKAAHERLSSIADNVPAGIFEFQYRPDGLGDLLYTSARFDDLVGKPGAGQGRSRPALFSQVHPEDLPAFLESIRSSADRLAPWSHRFRIVHPHRGTLWISGSATPKARADKTVVFTGVLNDVTEDARREAALTSAHRMAEEMRAENERQALHDGLTGLPNRRHYDQMLARRLTGAEMGEGPADCVLIRVDLDHFKYVNDTLGHEAGDAVLVRVAEVLRDSLRAGDFAARIGGDEFSILLAPGLTVADAQDTVRRIQAGIGKPFCYQGRPCRFGASFGIAHAGDFAETGAELQLFADAALYRAKEGGRSRMELFTPDLHRSILEDRRLAAELQDGLEADAFVPFFQPQVLAADGSLWGVEALLRWQHPERGILAPPAFLHVAEQLRMVPEIDRIMMAKSRCALARWRAAGLVVPKISFNVSSGRMHDPDVVHAAREVSAGETRVTFELLESILVEEESDAFRANLDAIRGMGIDIEIDDFGSGHASIIGLTEIAPSALKIDKRLVFPVVEDARARSLVHAIVEIAETLGIDIIAEGVETGAHAEILTGLRCHVLQGYFFAMPLSEADFLDFALKPSMRRA